jgi:hypothetical protein
MKAGSKTRESPVEKLGLALARFFLGALCGLTGTWVVLIECQEPAMQHETVGAVWLWLLWLIPVVWGLLAVFFFDRMLCAARTLFEDCFKR